MTYLKTPFLAAQPGPHHGWSARFLLLLALVVMTLPAYAAPEKRVALVIGNTQYTKSPLDNPGNDARLIADTLASPELGFTKVIRHNNLDRAGMIRAIKQFAVEARGAKVAFFYYSGHGIRGADGENYLQPIDKPGAAIETEDDVEIHAVPFNLVRAELGEENGRIALLMLDACRNNFTIKKRSDSNKDKGLKRDTAIGGMLIGYATQQGETAEDGTRGNSLFALSLASNLKKPGLEIVDVMRQVGADMKRQSGNSKKPQIPEIVIGSLFESYYLIGTPPPPGPATQLASLKPEPVNPTARPGQASGLSLDDLEKEETTRKEWAAWQARMKADYDKTAAFGGSADLRVKAWERFLGNYGQDNPLSREDEALRAQARQRQEAAQGEARQQTAVQAQPPAAQRATQPVRPTAPATTSAGPVFKDCAECPEMVVIPVGSFQMGGNDDYSNSNEKPVHSVTLKSFALGKYEVTQGQWKAVMGNNPSKFKVCGDTCPVENVSWNDIQEYIKKLNTSSGQQYRLPSEAEWEYACRAGANHTYCGSDNVDSVAVYGRKGGDKTQAVGGKQANAWGLHDMSGNVQEWVQDCDNISYNAAPSNGSAWTTGDCFSRGFRGGGLWDEPARTRAAFRGSISPDYRDDQHGFRLARNAP